MGKIFFKEKEILENNLTKSHVELAILSKISRDGCVSIRWETVNLDDLTKEELLKNPNNHLSCVGRYNMFLYRIKCLKKVFGEKIIIENSENMEEILNFSVKGKYKNYKESATNPKNSEESKIEAEVYNDYEQKDYKYLELLSIRKEGNLFRQVSVGLNKKPIKKPKKEDKIFINGSSCIDLVHFDKINKVISIYELKRPGISGGYGILSELFFYSMYVKDIILGNIKLDCCNEEERSFFEDACIHSYQIKSYFLVQNDINNNVADCVTLLNTYMNDKNLNIKFGTIAYGNGIKEI